MEASRRAEIEALAAEHRCPLDIADAIRELLADNTGLDTRLYEITHHHIGATRRVTSLECKLAKAKKALKPFAEAAEMAAWPTLEHDDCLIDSSFRLLVKNLRKARSTLSDIEDR